MKILLSFMLSLFCLHLPMAFAAQSGDWFFDPHAAIGYNPAQGTHFRLGLDIGVHITEQLSGGIGGFYSAGENPSHDREFGGGPFASFVQPLTSFLVASLRQEVNYVDMHNPIKTVTASGTKYSHTAETGVASATSAAVHFFFTPNFVLSGGYRLVLGLTNSKLDDDRSGAFVGFSLGI